jgi:hypothetical protein
VLGQKAFTHSGITGREGEREREREKKTKKKGKKGQYISKVLRIC